MPAIQGIENRKVQRSARAGDSLSWLFTFCTTRHVELVIKSTNSQLTRRIGGNLGEGTIEDRNVRESRCPQYASTQTEFYGQQGRIKVTPTLKSISGILLGLTLAVAASAQSSTEQSASGAQNSGEAQKQRPGAGSQIGRGAGNIGTGAAKGTGNMAKGAAAGAGDLVTLHPIRAGTSVGKGAATAGKNVTVGAAKGTGKIASGVGGLFKKLL